MRKNFRRVAWPVAIVLGLTVLLTGPVDAEPAHQFDDPVKQGEYLTTIAMCVFCHTPFKEQFNPEEFENLALDELRMAAFSLRDLMDESRLFAGGHEIPLGPAGVIVARNLTPDVETGLGDWTDEEIKTAIRSGVSRDGHQLNPVMPYQLYNGMAESDLDAIVAYLRSLPPIRTEIPHEAEQHMAMEDLPALPAREGIIAPDPSDAAARGEYLMSSVLICALCHTPVDEATGEPIMDLYMAGGQPFEGPWGIVYGGNLTPHQETGIGIWSDAEIKLMLVKGIRNDGRRGVLMPWQYYSVLTAQDADAIVHYLRNGIPPVDHEVPAPALLEGMFEYVELPAEEASGQNTALLIGLVASVVVFITAGALLIRKRQGAAGTG